MVGKSFNLKKEKVDEQEHEKDDGGFGCGMFSGRSDDRSGGRISAGRQFRSHRGRSQTLDAEISFAIV